MAGADHRLSCATCGNATGNVLAANYLRVPSSPAQSLQLTGRDLYTQVRTIPERYFIIHLYVARQDDSVLDISITNLFKDSKLVIYNRGSCRTELLCVCACALSVLPRACGLVDSILNLLLLTATHASPTHTSSSYFRIFPCRLATCSSTRASCRPSGRPCALIWSRFCSAAKNLASSASRLSRSVYLSLIRQAYVVHACARAFIWQGYFSVLCCVCT